MFIEPNELENETSNDNLAENIEETKALNLQLDEDNIVNEDQMEESSNHSQQRKKLGLHSALTSLNKHVLLTFSKD